MISRLSDSDAHTRLSAHLILAVLLKRLDRYNVDEAVGLGVAILAATDKALQNTALRSIEGAGDPMSSAFLGAIYSKPDDAQTARRATVSLLAAFREIRKLSAERMDWFAKSDGRSLATALYRHANSDALPPVLARTLLQRLFTILREEALTFFASVWTDVEVATPLGVAALRHASAFVKSYALGTDFQMVVPSILVAFTSTNEAVRESAVALLKVVNRSASNETKNYYALDTFYGTRSGQSFRASMSVALLMFPDKVQLLKHGDLIRYLQALIPALDDISVDAARLAAVHATALSMNHGRGRKETG